MPDNNQILSRGLKVAIDATEVSDGKIRFATDTEEIFIDYGARRIKITDLIIGNTEAEIRALASPLPDKLYLSSDTKILLYHNGTSWNTVNGAEGNTTYTIGTSNDNVTLTPSSGSVQSITVPYATKAASDDDGNSIKTTYAKTANLATVATSGSYNDLSNKPTIYTYEIGTLGNAVSLTPSSGSVQYITVPYATVAASDDDGNTIKTTYAKISSLATVATSGSYNDLSDTPEITDTTYTLGVSGDTVTLTPSEGEVQSITVPYATNAATVDSITKSQVTTALETTSGGTRFFKEDGTWAAVSTQDTTYTLGTAGNNVTLTPSEGQTQSITVPYATNALNATNDGDGNEISNTYAKSADLAAVATSGSYNDLSDQPEITDTTYTLVINNSNIGLMPSEGDPQYITVPFANNALNDYENNEIHTTYAKISSLATVATSGSYNDLFNKPEITDTTYEIGTSGNNVTLTPSEGQTQSITVPYATNAATVDSITKSQVTDALETDPSGTRFFKEDGTWATVSAQDTTYTLGVSGNDITLTPSEGQAQSITAPYATKALQDSTGNQINTTYAKTSELATVATSGSYDDLSDKPTITDTTYTLSVSESSVVLTPSEGEAQSITVPYATAALNATNDGDGNEIGSTYAKSADLAAVATSGSYDDLSDKPTITDTTYTIGTSSNTITLTPSEGQAQSITAPYATAALNDADGNEISDTYAKISTLATVATSGSYNDLSDQPEITDTTYTIGTSGNTVTLTPSEGEAQSITVPYATEAGNAATVDSITKSQVTTALETTSGGTRFFKEDGTWAAVSTQDTTYTLGVSGDTVTLTPSEGQAQSITVPYATKALQDSTGNQINTTYATKAELDSYAKSADLATVATSGSYNDLSDTPEISDTTYTLGTANNTITLTPSEGLAQSITAPYATKALQDSDGNQIDTTYAKSANLATVATSGSYNDLSNKPEIVNTTYTIGTSGNTVTLIPNEGSTQSITVPYATNALNATNDADGNDISDTYAKISSLATVATSGSYDDLSDTPAIPTVSSNSITISCNGSDLGSYNASSTDEDVAVNIVVPTKTSDLTNDAGFTTNIGTITGVSVNGTSVATSGNANITSIPASILTGAIPSNVTATTQSLGDNSTKLATTAYVDGSIAALPSPMVFKGSLGTGGTIQDLPTASSSNVGHTYKVITAGTYASIEAKVGDTFISDGTQWVLIPSGDEPSGTVTSVTITTEGPITVDESAPITTSGVRTIGHAVSGATAGSYGDSSAQTPDYGETFKVPYVTVNETGHVTSISEHTVTIPQSDDTTYTLGTSGNNVTLTASTDVYANSPQSITVPYAVRASQDADGNPLASSYAPISHSHSGSFTPEGTVSTPTITVTGATTTVPNVTSVGSVPSLTVTDITCDDITDWSAGSVTTASVSNGVLNITTGTAAALSFIARTIGSASNWSAGSTPTLGTAIEVLNGIASASSTQPTFNGTAGTVSVS